MKNNHTTGYINKAGHLTDEAVAMCVEAMMREQLLGELPDVVSSHLNECEVCNDRVTGLYMDVKDEPEILERITAPTHSEKPGFCINRKIYTYGVAAILLVFVAAGSYFMLQAPSSEKLFERNFAPYPNMITVKSNVVNDKAKAMLCYEVEDWDSAIVLFHQFLINKSYTPDVMFYLGNAYLAKGESEQAIHWFKEASTKSSGFDEQINWYLALAYLHKDDQDSARVYLEMLSNNDGFYEAKTSNLLKKLR